MTNVEATPSNFRDTQGEKAHNSIHHVDYPPPQLHFSIINIKHALDIDGVYLKPQVTQKRVHHDIHTSQASIYHNTIGTHKHRHIWPKVFGIQLHEELAIQRGKHQLKERRYDNNFATLGIPFNKN